MPTRKPPIKVVPGQIWADKDKRHEGRTVRVVETDNIRFVVLEVIADSSKTRPGKTSAIGRKSRVLFDDRGVRGYRLVSQPEEE